MRMTNSESIRHSLEKTAVHIQSSLNRLGEILHAEPGLDLDQLIELVGKQLQAFSLREAAAAELAARETQNQCANAARTHDTDECTVNSVGECIARDIEHLPLPAPNLTALLREARREEAKWWKEYYETNMGYRMLPNDPGSKRLASLKE